MSSDSLEGVHVTPHLAGRAARVAAVVLAVLWGFFIFGPMDLLAFLQGPEFHGSFHLETGWGLFFLVLVTAPLAGIAAGLLAVGSTGPRSALPRAERWAVWPAALVLAAAGPWLGFALASASSARAGRHVDVTNGLTHFPVQAALAIGIVLVVALAAGQPRGWAVPAGCAALCSAWSGTASLVYPDLDASLGRAWGAAAVAWGAAFAAATYLSRPRPG